MQIVAVQLDIAWEDKATNRRRVRELLANARIEPGALVVLPEMFETGFSMNVERAAQGDDRESESFLRELALEHDVAVLAGVVGPIVDARATNEAVAMAPDGTELARYVKMQPFTPAGEHAKYHSGDRCSVFQWGGAKIAPFVCYDLRFPELFRAATGEGAEVLVTIANWPATRSEHWVRLLQARAIENQAYAIGVNRCGADPKVGYDGRTAGFGAQGEPLFECDAREQVVLRQLDPETVRSWRSEFPALKDRRH